MAEAGPPAVAPAPPRKAVFTYRDKSMALHPGLSNYFNKKVFSDLTVVAPDGRSLHCHQIVLSSCSKRFANMLEQGSIQGEELPVWGVDSDALERIIKLFYTGECTFSQANVVPVFDAAQRLEVPGIVTACDAYVKDVINPANCCTFLAQAEQLKMEELSMFCMHYVEKRFEEVIQSEAFVAITPSILMQIVKANKNIQSDLTIFKAAWTWVIGDVKHVQYLEEILKIVKVPDITFQELIKLGTARVPQYPVNMRGMNMADMNFLGQNGMMPGQNSARLDLSQSTEEKNSVQKADLKSPVPPLPHPAQYPALQMQLLQQAMLSGAGFPMLVSVCHPLTDIRAGEYLAPDLSPVPDQGSTPSQKSEEALHPPIPKLFAHCVKEEDKTKSKSSAHDEESADGENDSARSAAMRGMCQVQGCSCDLAGLRDYHLRYKICEHHLKLEYIMKDGKPQRFCQQCGRFHHLSEFDGNKRSCRARLQRHNARRRKKVDGLDDGLLAASQPPLTPSKRIKAQDLNLEEKDTLNQLVSTSLLSTLAKTQPLRDILDRGEHHIGGQQPKHLLASELAQALPSAAMHSVQEPIREETCEQSADHTKLQVEKLSKALTSDGSWGLQILADVAQKGSKPVNSQGGAMAVVQGRTDGQDTSVGWGPKGKRSGAPRKLVNGDGSDRSSSDSEEAASGDGNQASQQWHERAQNLFPLAQANTINVSNPLAETFENRLTA